jgi:hypothetical protein
VQTTPNGKFSIALESGQIALKPTDGGAEKVLTSSPELKSELQLSPDGKHIAYLSQGHVWVVAVSGGESLQLTHNPKGPGDPRGATDLSPKVMSSPHHSTAPNNAFRQAGCPR